MDLLSTGELQRRLGRSKSGVRKLIVEGTLPPPITITGSGKLVWPASAWPEIEEAVRRRPDRRRKVRAHSETP